MGKDIQSEKNDWVMVSDDNEAPKKTEGDKSPSQSVGSWLHPLEVFYALSAAILGNIVSAKEPVKTDTTEVDIAVNEVDIAVNEVGIAVNEVGIAVKKEPTWAERAATPPSDPKSVVRYQ